MIISIADDWSPAWISSGSVIERLGSILRCTSLATGGSAFAYRHIATCPGDEWELEVEARRVQGVDGTSGGFAIGVNGTSRQDYVEVNFDDWQLYKAKIAAQRYTNDEGYLRIAFGLFSERIGVIEYRNPQLRKKKGRYGAIEQRAAGMIRLNSGVPSLVSDRVTFNLRNLVYDAANMELRIESSVFANQAKPIIHAQFTLDSAPHTLICETQYITSPIVGIKVKFRDLAAGGAFVDITNRGNLYIHLISMG